MQAAATTTSSLVLPLPASQVAGGRSPWRRNAPVFGGHLKSSRYLKHKCCAISWPKNDQSSTYFDLLQNNAQSPLKSGNLLPTWAHILTKDKGDLEYLGVRIEKIKEMLSSMGDGEISISPYDTAWVSLIPNIHGHDGPQFPSSLQWIIDNQLDDGSWGDAGIFNAYDRLINTLGCVIALKTWKSSPDQSARGIEFLQSNMYKLGEESVEHLPIGFEVAFPSLLDMAYSLSIDIPYGNPMLQTLQDMRDEKLKRIPLDVVHNVPTTLLHSLEGMMNLVDWKKLLKLKCSNGSFLFSPASTACAVMNTKDESCIKYLENMVSRFNGGVPNVYPVDLFEHIWVVDRLQRLGISRYFQEDIKQCVEYISKYWTEDGICWARISPVLDVDDTAMGFRILRLHGYDVTPDVFKNFRKGDEFICFAGQSNQAVTGIYNLNRASQVAFPGEMILEDAKKFSYRFLRQKQARNELLDKWIITKDLPGEVSYALDYPWIMSLPRVEARTFLDQYGGDDDVWIGKTLYRMPYVNNNTFLELAKSDFNHCQILLQEEWIKLRKWFIQYELAQYGVSTRRLLEIFFLAASTMFEPERSNERLTWARTAMLVEALYSYTKQVGDYTLLDKLYEELQNQDTSSTKSCLQQNMLIEALKKTIDDISIHTMMIMEQEQGLGLENQHESTKNHQHIKQKLLQVWLDWMVNVSKRGLEDSHDEDAILFVRTLELCVGRFGLEEALSYSSARIASNVYHPNNHNGDTDKSKVQEYIQLISLTRSICQSLLYKDCPIGQLDFVSSDASTPSEYDIQKLTKYVLDGHSQMDINTRQTFLTVVKSIHYASHCPASTMNIHIGKVLFERVPQ